MKFSLVRVWASAAILCAIPALAQAQQQFGDPTNYPGQYLVQRGSPPNGSSIDVTYVVGPGFSPAMAGLITQAAAVWNSAGAHVQLVTTGIPTININSFSAPVLFPGSPSPYTVSPVLGTYPPPDGTSFRQILNATSTVNTNNSPSGVPWFFGPGTAPPGQYDFLAFMVQQFGHALGLGFVNDPSSVMNVNSGTGLFMPGPSLQGPSAADIAALQTLYGAPEPATWALFGVGLAALGALKKARRRSTPAL